MTNKNVFFFLKKHFNFVTKYTSGSTFGTFSQTRNHFDKIEKSYSLHRIACMFQCLAVVRKTRFLLSRTPAHMHANNTRIHKQCRFGLFRIVVENLIVLIVGRVYHSISIQCHVHYYFCFFPGQVTFFSVFTMCQKKNINCIILIYLVRS